MHDHQRPTGLGDYVITTSCSGEGPTDGSSQQVTVTAGENVECTITNVRRGSIKVTKDLDPSDDAGRFDLRVESDVVKNAAADGEFGTKTGLAPGSYTVSELADEASPTGLDDYVITTSCSGEGSTSGSSQQVTVAAGENVECTITNVRRGSIKVTKDLDPNDDAGRFDLRVDSDVVRDEAADGESGTKTGLAPGTFTVSEVAGSTSPTGLGDYVISTQCSGEGPASAGSSLSVTVSSGENVECTITNVRRGSIKVTKDLDPNDDAGRFDLKVDSDVVRDEAADGESGTKTGLAPGSYTVSEVAGSTSPTALGDYVISTQCSGEGPASAGSSLSVTVSSGENVECTITNVRRGSIKVTKDLDPNDDAGRFDLKVDSDVVRDEAADGESGTKTGLAPGSYTVSEVAGSTSPTALGDYVISTQCSGEGAATAGSSLSVTVSAGENVECTITNVRRGSIKVTKDLDPNDDAGRFDLRVDSDVVRDEAADGESGTKTGLAPGTFTVSEVAGSTSPTGLGDYAISTQCSGEGPASAGSSLVVNVSAGENVECTITNVRRGSIKVTKDLDPNDDAGRFDLRVESDVVKNAAADGEFGTKTGLAPGSYTVSELADEASPTGLGDYVITTSCSGEGSTSGASQQVTVAAGENVECTITNVRRGSIKVTKDLDPNDDAGRFDLRVDSDVVRDEAADGESGTKTGLAPG